MYLFILIVGRRKEIVLIFEDLYIAWLKWEQSTGCYSAAASARESMPGEVPSIGRHYNHQDIVGLSPMSFPG